MRLLLDQGMRVDATPLLRSLDYQCTHVAELGLHQAEDEDIVALARETDAVVITLDADFHALVAVRGWRHPSVVRLPRQGSRAEELAGLLHSVLIHYREELATGSLISIRESRTTVHRLPIHRPA